MKDPVILPSSKTTVDLSTIQRHLLSDQVWLGKVKNPLKDFNVLGTYLKLVSALHETRVILQVWPFLFGNVCRQTHSTGQFLHLICSSQMLSWRPELMNIYHLDKDSADCLLEHYSCGWSICCEYLKLMMWDMKSI
jgi:hypothetical protein